MDNGGTYSTNLYAQARKYKQKWLLVAHVWEKAGEIRGKVKMTTGALLYFRDNYREVDREEDEGTRRVKNED